jgi:surface antigen
VLVATAAVACSASGCLTSSQGGLSNQAIGTGTGAAIGAGVGAVVGKGRTGSILIGALLGGLVGNLFGRFLDEREQSKLAEATSRAFDSETGRLTTYEVEARRSDAQPTIVSARATAPAETRKDGSYCRPIEQTATKDGQTKSGTTVFCKSAGSEQLKPVAI